MKITPTSFVPSEDQGIIRMSMQLPDGTSFNRTVEETEKVRKALTENLDNVASILVMTGFDTQASDIRPNTATYVVRLVDWAEREKRRRSCAAKCRPLQIRAPTRFR